MHAQQTPGQRSPSAAGEHALLRRYFAEIGQVPVLSAAQEGELARRLREAEDELRALLEPLPLTAGLLVERWREIRSEGRVTGQLSRRHAPPASDCSASVDRAAARLERLLRERAALLRRRVAREASVRVERRIASCVRAAELRPELLHEALAVLRAQAGAGPRAVLAAAEAAAQRGRAAKDSFIRHNLRLVVHQAKGFRSYGVPFPDLIQEGTLGLIRAVEKFDERLGNRFSTYAIWWIQQSCMRAVQQSARTVRLPSPVQDEIRRYKRAAEGLALRAPGAPRPGDVARVLGVPSAEAEGLARLDRSTLRLDEPVPGRERGSLGEQLVDVRPRGDADADRARLEREVGALLAALPRRDREILRARFGFSDGEAQTLQDVASTLGISRERVRQLEHRALERIAAAARAAGLEDWLGARDFSG